MQVRCAEKKAKWQLTLVAQKKAGPAGTPEQRPAPSNALLHSCRHHKPYHAHAHHPSAQDRR